MGGKWIELLKETAPRLSRALVIYGYDNPIYLPSMRTLADRIGVTLIDPHIRKTEQIESAIAAVAQTPDGGVITMPGNFTGPRRSHILELIARHRMPSIHGFRNYVTEGGLISYGVDAPEIFRRSASYVDRILRGANPGDLPIQLPTRIRVGHQPQNRQGAWS